MYPTLFSLRKSLLLAAILFSPCIAVQAASFDCTRSTTQVERTICTTPDLSGMDETLAEVYEPTVAREDANGSLKASQRAWLAQRNKCSDAACLRQLYEKRIGELACGYNNTGSAIGANLCHASQQHQADLALKPLEERYAKKLAASAENPGRVKSLMGAERKSWQDYRDTHCELEAEALGGAPGWKSATSAACSVDETRKRIAGMEKALVGK
jgi:uncharacterized protein YecT (DUF1311 family)